MYYTPTILRSAGLQSRNAVLLATVLVGVAKTICILIAACIVDRYPPNDRRADPRKFVQSTRG